MSITHYLAFDLGAESGRAFVGSLEDGHLAVEELYRFSNSPIAVQGRCIGISSPFTTIC